MNSPVPSRRPRPILVAMVCVLALVVPAGVFLGWALTPRPATSLALDALATDESVAVMTEPWLAFIPKTEPSMGDSATPVPNAPAAGFIFYPDSHVDIRAYAPLLREIARAGHVAVLVPMPFNLPRLGTGTADRVRESFPMVRRWVLCGHADGGLAMMGYAATALAPEARVPVLDGAQPSRISGLVLLASVPDSDLSRYGGFPVLAIAGSRDQLSPPAKIRAAAGLLPPGAVVLEVPGANHAQFCAAGDQDGDGTATLSPADQRQASAKAILGFINALK